MKYFVEMIPTNAHALEMEDKGGPGPVLGHIMETFKPEAAYVMANARGLLLVVDVADHAKAFELMLVGSRLCGQEPRMIPVIPAAEGAKVIPNAIAGANKAPRLQIDVTSCGCGVCRSRVLFVAI